MSILNRDITMVDLIGRRFIRDHQDALASFLGLPAGRRQIPKIKECLRDSHTPPTLKSRLDLPSNCPVDELVKRIKSRVTRIEHNRSHGLPANASEDDLSKAVFIREVGHLV